MGLKRSNLKRLRLSLALLFAVVIFPAQAENPQLRLRTEFGEIIIELFHDKAPATVDAILTLVTAYHYDGLIFHRVVPGFVIQTGGFNFDLSYREAGTDTVVNESFNGLSNTRGSVAMARQSDPDSARAQFFINLNDNRRLDARGDKPGYTVFGQVREGMDVADKIGAVETEDTETFKNVPVEAVYILSARLLNPNSWTPPPPKEPADE